ncbi:uncharacterized protein [Prorops nasuta]|uniref:uncharacterized protein n=1 Tax=Prorops nasuta TaxID=863751 RepID=UPI0034CD5EBB
MSPTEDHRCLLTKMDFPQSSYYKLNLFLLTLSGIAPYQNKLSSNAIRIMYTSLSFFGCFSQTLKLIEEKFEKSLFFNIVPVLVYTVIYLSTYFIIAARSNKPTEELWDMMIDDWLSQRLEEENKIKERYAYHAYFASILISVIFFSEILDYFVPLNETRPHLYIFPSETFNDGQKYFYLNISIVICIFIVMAVPSIALFLAFCLYVQHACGMFAVLGYRLEHALPKSILETCDINVIDNCCKATLRLCIQRHQKAVKFVALAETYFSPFIFIMAGGVVLFLSISLSSSIEKNALQFRAVLQLLMFTGGLWICTYLGQRLIDHSTDINVKAYNYPWYICRPSMRKHIPLIMERSSRACMLTGFKLIPLSLDTCRVVSFSNSFKIYQVIIIFLMNYFNILADAYGSFLLYGFKETIILLNALMNVHENLVSMSFSVEL